MQARNKILIALLCLCMGAKAQTGNTMSSYSRFGMGSLADASSSENVSMGGTGVAMRSGDKVNMVNPASYAACDSLTFICNLGMSLGLGRLSNGTSTQTVRNTSFDNVNALFRIRKGLGMSVGFVPFSSIGYSFVSSNAIGSATLTQTSISSNTTYVGDGGLRNVYAGLGWEPVKGLSVGVNIGYLWGSYNHAITQSFLEDNTTSSVYDALVTAYTAEVRSYKLDAGVQGIIPLKDNNRLVVGATVGIGHKMSGDAMVLRYTSNGDSVYHNLENAFDMPWSFGAGVAWYQGTRWMVTADYRGERWGACRLPQITANGATASEMQAISTTGSMLNRHRLSVGMEYTPDIHKAKYSQRIRYRAGACYSTPYYKVNGYDGPTEYSVGVGFGLPISNNINNRSVVNVGVQWAHVQPGRGSNIKENYFRLNIGITFNEEWFMKWKIR